MDSQSATNQFSDSSQHCRFTHSLLLKLILGFLSVFLSFLFSPVYGPLKHELSCMFINTSPSSLSQILLQPLVLFPPLTGEES